MPTVTHDIANEPLSPSGETADGRGTEAASVAPPDIQMIAVERLVPTKDNPRALRKDKAFEELAASIRSVGVLQPLIARPLANSVLFDLRAGHRRLAAAKAAGLTRVPVIVRAMDDKTAMEITTMENLHRENLTPLEESRSIQNLLRVGWNHESIGERLGKTPQWVARRAKLGELSDAWKNAAADPKHAASLWPATLLEVVAKLPAATQDAVLEMLRHGTLNPCERGEMLPSAAQLERWIAAEYLGTLGGAPWKLDDETLLPKAGACTACPKRSSVEPLLFEELAEGGKKRNVAADHCLDQGCYKQKQDALCKRKMAELEKEHGKALPVITSYLGWIETKELEKKWKGLKQTNVGYGDDNYSLAKPNEKGATPAVVVSGKNAGTVCWVKNGNPYTGYGGGRQKREKGKPTPLKERKEALEKRRFAHVIEAVRGKLDEWAEDEKQELPKAINTVQAAVALAIAFGTRHKRDTTYVEPMVPWKLLETDWKRASVDTADALIRQVLPVLRDRLNFQNGDGARRLYPECQRVAELLELDFKAMEQAAAAEIPEPKGWANLKPDGTPKSPSASAVAKQADERSGEASKAAKGGGTRVQRVERVGRRVTNGRNGGVDGDTRRAGSRGLVR